MNLSGTTDVLYLHIYHRDNAAGLNAVIEAQGVLVLGVLSLGQEVLLPREVGLVVDHERAALHPAGAAAAQVRGDLRAVADALIGAALEVSLLEEHDLEGKTQIGFSVQKLCAAVFRLKFVASDAHVTFPLMVKLFDLCCSPHGCAAFYASCDMKRICPSIV